MKNIFMTNSEQMNCTFEPLTGSLNPNRALARKVLDAQKYDEMIKESSVDQFIDKLGTNLEKLHPEVFKLGILKKANLLTSKGDFATAISTIEAGFNCVSLKRRWRKGYNAIYMKKQMREGMKNKFSQEKDAQDTVEASWIQSIAAAKAAEGDEKRGAP